MDASESGGHKKDEIHTYDNPTPTRGIHGAIWDDDHLHELFDIGAETQFQNYLTDHASNGAVLVLGCGGGKDLRRIHEINSGRSIAGIEIATKPLKEARLACEGIADIRLCRSDAERLPFDDETFNAVIARATLHHLPNVDTDGMSEISRVLTDTGSLIFFEPGAHNPPAYLRRRFFPSQSHTPGEQPFNPRNLRSLLQKHFNTVTLDGYYVFSTILPVIDHYLPVKLPRSFTRACHRLEQRIPSNELVSWILVGHAMQPK